MVMNLIYSLRNNDSVSCIDIKNTFLLAGSDHVSIWDMKTGKLVSKDHKRTATILKMISWHDRVAIHARDNSIKVCSLPDLEVLSEISVNTLNFCGFERDSGGSLYFPADNDSDKIQILNLSNVGYLSPPYSAGILMVLFHFSHLGRPHLAAGFEDGSVAVWDIEGETCKINKDHSEPVLSLYVVEDFGVISGGADGKVNIRYFSQDLTTCDCIEFEDVKGIACLAYSPSKSVIAAGGWDGCVYIIPHNDLQNYTVIEYHRGRINNVLFLDDAKKSEQAQDVEDWICPNDSLFVASDDGRISIWAF
jgi:WD40 repeat protein